MANSQGTTNRIIPPSGLTGTVSVNDRTYSAQDMLEMITALQTHNQPNSTSPQPKESGWGAKEVLITAFITVVSWIIIAIITFYSVTGATDKQVAVLEERLKTLTESNTALREDISKLQEKTNNLDITIQTKILK